MYEAEGTFVRCAVSFVPGAKSVSLTNMLEEVTEPLGCADSFTVELKPFEIKTFKVEY